MAQFCNIPLLNPVKFVNNTATPGTHFDDDWHINQIKSWERSVVYKQKWQDKDDVTIQIESTIAPGNLKCYNCKQEIVDEFTWSTVLTGTQASVYQVTVNLDYAYTNLGPNKTMYLYFECTLLDTSFKWISEPIEFKQVQSNTRVIEYYNTYNDFGAFFIDTGFRPRFRCEMDIMEFAPGREKSAFIDQLRDVKTLSATPWRSFKLQVGDARGVAPWVIDILNRAFSCDRVLIDGKRYDTEESAKWDINRPAKGYPLVGAEIEIVESFNEYSNQQTTVDIEPGIVTGFIINSEFTGTAQDIQVEEITITS